MWDFCFAVVGLSPPLLPLSQVSFCRADASQVGASPLGSRLSPIKTSALEPYPAIPSLHQPEGSILLSPRFSVGYGFVFKASALGSTRGLTLCSQMYGLRPPIRARIRVIPAGQFQCLCFDPFSCLPQASICSADVSQVGASATGLRPRPSADGAMRSTGGFSLEALNL